MLTSVHTGWYPSSVDWEHILQGLCGRLTVYLGLLFDWGWSLLTRYSTLNRVFSLSENPRTTLPTPAGARMIPILVKRPWYVFCRVSLQHRASLSHRLPRTPQLSGGALIWLNPHLTLVYTRVSSFNMLLVSNLVWLQRYWWTQPGRFNLYRLNRLARGRPAQRVVSPARLSCSVSMSRPATLLLYIWWQ